MKGDGKYYALIVLVFLVLFGIEYTQEEPTNYIHTFSHKDKKPYGGFVLREMMSDILGDVEVYNVNLTLYEIEHDLSPDKNLLIIADNMSAAEEDVNVLLSAVDAGMDAMIVSQSMWALADTLGFDTEYNQFSYLINADQDTTSISFVNSKMPGGEFRYKKDVLTYYLSDLEDLEYDLIAQDEDRNPLAIRVKIGRGNLYLCTTPLAFTNNYLFFEKNHQYVSSLLSFFSKKDLIWSEYYQLGRLEVRTPLRVVLTSPPLKLAYTVTIVAVLLFMIFEAKRKQRIIPIIKPLTNTTLEFIGTIANLYLRKKDHSDIAQKRIQYFLEYIHNHYFLNFKRFDRDFFERLAAKSGNDVVEVKKLFDLIQRIKEQDRVSEEELKLLSDKIEAFYGRKHR